jgi:hypothetical protein
MDISGLTSTSASQSFPGYGGTASLPAVTQAKMMAQSQSLSLLPTASSANLGNLANIYDAVGKQALGALSGLSALEITNLSMGIGDGQTTAAPMASTGASTPATAASASLAANAASNFPGSYYPSSADADYFFHSSPTTTSAAEAIDPNTADPNGTTASSSSAAQASSDTSVTQGSSASTSSSKNPAIGATLDQLLKEDGYVAPDANPYVVNTDFFSGQGSLGGLLDSTV